MVVRCENHTERIVRENANSLSITAADMCSYHLDMKG